MNQYHITRIIFFTFFQRTNISLANLLFFWLVLRMPPEKILNISKQESSMIGIQMENLNERWLCLQKFIEVDEKLFLFILELPLYWIFQWHSFQYKECYFGWHILLLCQIEPLSCQPDQLCYQPISMIIINHEEESGFFDIC